jgi:hypothetical protein
MRSHSASSARAAGVVGQVLVPGVLARIEPGVLEGACDGGGVHALRAAAHHAPADAGVVDRLARRGDAWGGRAAAIALGRPGRGHQVLAFVCGFGSGTPPERCATASEYVPKHDSCHRWRPPTCGFGAAKHSGCHQVGTLLVTSSVETRPLSPAPVPVGHLTRSAVSPCPVAFRVQGTRL